MPNKIHHCKGETAAGDKCKRNAVPGSKYCWQHMNGGVSPKVKRVVGTTKVAAAPTKKNKKPFVETHIGIDPASMHGDMDLDDTSTIPKNWRKYHYIYACGGSNYIRLFLLPGHEEVVYNDGNKKGIKSTIVQLYDKRLPKGLLNGTVRHPKVKVANFARSYGYIGEHERADIYSMQVMRQYHQGKNSKVKMLPQLRLNGRIIKFIDVSSVNFNKFVNDDSADTLYRALKRINQIDARSLPKDQLQFM